MAELWGGPFDGQSIEVAEGTIVLRLPMISQATPKMWAQEGMELPRACLDIALYSKTSTSEYYRYAGMEHVR